MEIPRQSPINKSQEFVSKYSKPLESLIEDINMERLVKREDAYNERGPNYESESLESVDESWRRGAGIHAKTPYVVHILRLTEGINKENAKKFLESIGGSVVLDLGSGDGMGEKPFGYMLAQSLGAKTYVGVDKFHNPQFDYIDVLKIKRRLDMSSEDIPFAMIKEDALDFLHRVPDNSVSVFTFALTRQISIKRPYAKQIEKEIARVLSPSGVYISHFSDFEPSGLEKTKYSDFDMFDGLSKFTKSS